MSETVTATARHTVMVRSRVDNGRGTFRTEWTQTFAASGKAAALRKARAYVAKQCCRSDWSHEKVWTVPGTTFTYLDLMPAVRS